MRELVMKFIEKIYVGWKTVDKDMHIVSSRFKQ